MCSSTDGASLPRLLPSLVVDAIFPRNAAGLPKNSRTRFKNRTWFGTQTRRGTRSREPGSKTEPGSVPRREVGTRSREPGSRVSTAPARSSSARPEGAEVHGRVAGLPSLEKPLDRRVQHDLAELVVREEPRALDGRVARLDVLQRAVGQIGREDDVDDVLAADERLRRDRVADRDRPLELHVRLDAELLPQLPSERLDQRLAAVHPAAGQQPVLLAGLLLSAEQHAPLPAEDRAHTDARLHQCRDDPKPRTPRSLAGSSSTSTRSSSGIGSTTSWAIRIPGSTTNGSRRSMLTRLTSNSPR